MDEGESFSQADLKAHANPEFIASVFADVLRNLMRAVSVRDDALISQTHKAAVDMMVVDQLLAMADPKIDMRTIFRLAVDDIRAGLVVADDEDDREWAELRLAQVATQYLIEKSCRDRGAKGRAGDRWNRLADRLNALGYQRR